MTGDEFKALKAQAAEDLKFDQSNAMEKCQGIPGLYQRWLDVFSKESAILVKFQIAKDKVYGELYKKYHFEDNYKWDAQKECESQVKSDAEYIKVALEYEKQKLVVDYLQETLGNINRMSFSIKNYLDYLKYQGGFGL